ncbi:MAG: DUF4389 domain-containing protein [Actinobacteria bacterium]|nr:DUF4389 domain-containing protein [Actinomycetota bacterium]
MSNQIETTYQVQLENRDRQTVFWRAILVAPVAFFVSSFAVDSWNGSWNAPTFGLFVLPVILALAVRGTYPTYLLAFNKALFGLLNRVWAYLALLTDEYPSIEENNAVSIRYPEIDGGKTLSRGLPLIKWAMAIPLVIVGFFYELYALLMLILAWFNIIINGQMPEVCADVLVRTSQYWNRVYGYAVLLVTDEYPTFSL